MAHVHIYYHGTETVTKYTGAIRIGFFDQPHEMNPNITVKPGERAGNESISDFVTDKPGTYPLGIAVVATSIPSDQKQDIRDQVTVTVKP